MSNKLPDIKRDKVNELLDSGRPIKSVFDIKENRDMLEDPSIPNSTGLIYNGQLSKSEFNTFYNVYESGYSSYMTNTTIKYLQSVNTFKFRRFYHEIAEAIMNDKIIISKFREEQLLEVIKIAHLANTDYRLTSNNGISPYIQVDNGNLMDYETELMSFKLNNTEVSRFVWKEHPQNKGKFITLFNGYVDWDNIVNKNTYSKDDINDILNGKVDKDDIFDKNGNILNKHIDFIFNLEGTKFDKHIKNNDIHVSISEKNNWNGKYKKPEHGIPKLDLDGECQTTLDDSVKHMKNNVVHITAHERREWNNAFRLPVDGINMDILHRDVVIKLNSIFPKEDIIDCETNQIYPSLIPIDTSTFVSTSAFTAHVTNYTNHVTDDNIHVSGPDRITWNGKYSRPFNGIPKSDLEGNLQTKIDASIEWNDIVDPNTNKIYTNLIGSSGGNGGASDSHINDSTIHVTTNDKNTWSRKYDGSSSSMLPLDISDSSRRCIPDSHLSQNINDLLDTAVTRIEIFEPNGKIASSKIDGLPNMTTINNHISNNNIHVTTSEKSKIAEAITRTELLDNKGQILPKYLPVVAEALSQW